MAGKSEEANFDEGSSGGASSGRLDSRAGGSRPGQRPGSSRASGGPGGQRPGGQRPGGGPGGQRPGSQPAAASRAQKPKRRVRRKSSAAYSTASDAAQLPDDFLMRSPAGGHAVPAPAAPGMPAPGGLAASTSNGSISPTARGRIEPGPNPNLGPDTKTDPKTDPKANPKTNFNSNPAQRRSSPGLHLPPKLDASIGTVDLAPFAAYGAGSLAPWWLSYGVCDEWDLNVFSTEIRLIAVSENATFAVFVHGKPVAVVRVSQPGYAGGAVGVASEAAWLNALRDIDGVRVVRNVPTASGFPVASIHDEGGREWVCVCMEFVPGESLDAVAGSGRWFRAIGEAAARLHVRARGWDPPAGFKRFTWGIDDMVGECPRWGRWQDHVRDAAARDLFASAQEAAESVLAAIPRSPQNWGLVHGDLRPANLILRPDGGFTIIDFDDCGYSWFMYDFAAALSFVEHEPGAASLARGWMEGYESVTTLTDADIECACALSMLRRLQLLGWAAGHYPDALPSHLRNTLESGTVLCAQRYLANPLWLVRS